MSQQPSKLPNIAILVLAAGASTRMRGQDKNLRSIDGRTLIELTTSEALASHARRVVVILGKDALLRQSPIKHLSVDIIENKNWSQGMGATIACGINSLDRSVEAVIIALADMPDIRSQDYNQLISAFDQSGPAQIIRAATNDNRPGHPVLFGRKYFIDLAGLSADTGARMVLEKNTAQIIDIPLMGERARTDLDTPEDWDDYSA